MKDLEGASVEDLRMEKNVNAYFVIHVYLLRWRCRDPGSLDHAPFQLVLGFEMYGTFQPLGYAAYYGNTEVVAMLINAGADLNFRDSVVCCVIMIRLSSCCGYDYKRA